MQERLDNLYDRISGFEEATELYPERTKTGRIIKRIILTFPVYYNGHESREMWLPEENTVETVVQLSKGEINAHRVRVEFDLDEMDM